MNCNEAIQYIHSLERFGINPGLERIGALCDILGNPQKSLRFVHVAGTNGKGSTSTIISNILIKAGYATGLFTSPYVVDFRERIQFNGCMIEPYELADAVSEVKTAVEILNIRGVFPTEFETITATAFLYFKKKKCDFVVLEVGLGGRFDATNIIDCPVVNVITSISKDHTAVLGDTLSKIAFEKCGTIKENGVCVCYPEQDKEALEVIKTTCKEKNAQLIIPDLTNIKQLNVGAAGTEFQYDGIDYSLPLVGAHMVKNAVTAINAVKVIKKAEFNIPDKAFSLGVASSVMPARLEIMRKKPLIILDGGHNEGCANAVAGYIGTFLKGRKITAVVSMMADKDYDSYLRITAPFFRRIVATHTNVPRALPADELCETAKKYCGDCVDIADSAHALKYAFGTLEKDDVLLVCGSFYFAGEIREKIIDLQVNSYD
ncbi:MAG: bifunctional folylpolyglutamate synthase/dihydrofolate synthase [Clostridia bacterium]|nr:bifunctional folylpolyglutamate synthase/dihydrofolate synthase [Clostridia bacterium]